ncbi:hypothetical protein SLW56_05550 [Xanthomonas sp. LF07-6]|uniref:hypothetical protein n=1 Tax=Xanthomonas sp. LF07-6 TaxID=3097550 RepID=UPI002A80BBBA|nr:hypothetical protein [Xanthomonas sp. LF07-6]MDY4339236.1 hypothetical protein [Xanthomonas sp. LF07-6]
MSIGSISTPMSVPRPLPRPGFAVAVALALALAVFALALALAFALAFALALALALAFAFAFAVAVAVAVAFAFAVAFALTGSLPKRRPARGKTPKGRRTWTCAVRGRGRMPLPRIPGLDADPERVSAEGARQGVLSFGYFSLHKQRSASQQPKADQSDSPPGESFALEDASAVAEL